MKKFYLVILLAALISCNLSAQFYIAPRASFYFPVNSNWVGTYGSGGNSTGWYVFNPYHCPLGNGNTAGGAIGFQTSGILSFEAFAGIHNGKSASRVFTDTSGRYPFRVEHQMNAEFKQTKVGVAAGLRILRGSWTFETNSSVFIGFNNQLLLKQNVKHYANNSPDSENEYTTLQYGGVAPGFCQAFQIGYQFNRYIKSVIGVELVGQYWKPKLGEQGTIRYVYTDEIPQPDLNAQPGDPSKAFVQTYTLNTIGIRCGIVFLLPFPGLSSESKSK